MEMSRGPRWIAVLLLGVGLSGCGAVKTWHASSAQFDTEKPETLKLADQDEMTHLAWRFGLMALFAKVVYRDDLGKNPGKGQGCSYLDMPGRTQQPPAYGMPHDANGSWKRWDEVIDANSPPCMDDGGLYYETYLHTSKDGTLNEAVIAFRGTENSRSQIVSDWSTNFAAALGFQPSQYRLAAAAMPGLIKALTAQFKAKGNRPVRIYAVGHSLGGGLAQQLAYMSEHVKAAVTFNTSPVTNWSALRLTGLVRKDYPTIYRFEHGGEFLGLPRAIATAFTSPRFGRYDFGLQIDKRSLIRGHAMGIFACRFAQLVVNAPDEAPYNAAVADHHYPKSYARQILVAAQAPETTSPKPENWAICEKEAALIDQAPDVTGKAIDARPLVSQ